MTKTCNKTCVKSKDSGQPVYPPSMTRVLVYTSLDSLKSCIRHMRSARNDQTADVQADLSLHYSQFSLIVGFVMNWLIFISVLLNDQLFASNRITLLFTCGVIIYGIIQTTKWCPARLKIPFKNRWVSL